MSAYSNVSLPPILETVKHKTDNLDWDNMPAGACDLNYPVILTVTWRERIRTLSLLLLVSALSPPAACLIGMSIAGTLSAWPCGVGAAIIGIALFAYHHRERFQEIESEPPLLVCWHSWALLFGPTFLWLSIILLGRLNEPLGAFLYYGLIATPALFVLADLIATHTVHWLSAGLSLDHETLLRWREDWNQRFLDDPAILPASSDPQDKQNAANHHAASASRHNYFMSGFWLAGALLLPCLALMVLVPEPRHDTIGLQIVSGAIFGLILAGWIRCQGRWKAIKQIGRGLTHWLHYGDQGQLPPWVFHSPCGSLLFRRFLTALTLGYLSVALGSLAVKPTVCLISTFDVSTTISSSQMSDDHIAPYSVVESPTLKSLAAFTWMQWLLFGAILLISTLIPPIVLYAGIMVVIGPVVYAYTDALATNGVQ